MCVAFSVSQAADMSDITFPCNYGLWAICGRMTEVNAKWTPNDFLTGHFYICVIRLKEGL